jgi:peptide-methionine (R)-S-oxide reductase
MKAMILTALAIATAATLMGGCARTQAKDPASQATQKTPAMRASAVKASAKIRPDAPPVGQTLSLPDAEWRKKLNDIEYRVLRRQGTERAFTGDLWNHKGDGVYTCAGCGAPLFDSDTKFKSGTGWPSFYTPIQEGRVSEHKDHSHGMTRVEVRCSRCNGHLGHVFDDGPRPTGLRYCINSAALDFEAVSQAASPASK